MCVDILLKGELTTVKSKEFMSSSTEINESMKNVELSERSFSNLQLTNESIPEKAQTQYDLVEYMQKLSNGENELRINKCDICERICKNYKGMRVHRAACMKKYKVI
jgi:hypothetical protein